MTRPSAWAARWAPCVAVWHAVESGCRPLDPQKRHPHGRRIGGDPDGAESRCGHRASRPRADLPCRGPVRVRPLDRYKPARAGLRDCPRARGAQGACSLGAESGRVGDSARRNGTGCGRNPLASIDARWTLQRPGSCHSPCGTLRGNPTAGCPTRSRQDNWNYRASARSARPTGR